MNTIRDRLWIWGHEAGAHNGRWNVGRSRMTPAEAASYLGVPNVVMVRFANEPRPPFDQYQLSFASLRQVIWSIIGDAGTVVNDDGGSDLEEVLRLSRAFPNVKGAIMDDFFRQPGGEPADDSCGRYALQSLREFRRRLHAGPHSLDLWVVLYAHQLDLPVRAHLSECDGVTFWTWQARDLDRLEMNLHAAEELAPGRRMMLGCYLWDYGADGAAMPLELMQHQCRLGLEWLEQGRIEGMIFLASCICDLGLEAVEWTRRWIAAVGDKPLMRPSA